MLSLAARDKSGQWKRLTMQTRTKPPATGTLLKKKDVSAGRETVDMEDGEKETLSGPSVQLPLLRVKPAFSLGGDMLNELEPIPQFTLKAAASDTRGSVDKDREQLGAVTAARAATTTPPNAAIATTMLWDESEPPPQPAAATTTTAASLVAVTTTTSLVAKLPLEDALWSSPALAKGSSLSAVPAATAAGDFDLSEFLLEHRSLFHGGSAGCTGGGGAAGMEAQVGPVAGPGAGLGEVLAESLQAQVL